MDERAGTSPPVMDFEGMANRIEYVHSETKQFKSEQSNVNLAIDRRVSRLEFLGEQTGERLNGGAQTFAKLEGQIERVNAKIEGPVWKTVMKVVGFAAPSVLFAIHLTWQAAHYPDDQKFEALKVEVMEQKVQMVRFEGTLGRIDDNSKLQAQMTEAANRKLDDLLLHGPATRGSGGGSSGVP
jgi:hypothetical protein